MGGELDLTLDKPDLIFQPGEAITGAVLLRTAPEKPVKAERLTVWLRWATVGKGNEDAGATAETELLSAPLELAGGRAHRATFALTAPDSPASFRGKLLSIVWKIEARAYLSWAVDPRAALGITLARAAPRSRAPAEGGGVKSVPVVSGGTGCLAGAAVLALVALWFMDLVPGIGVGLMIAAGLLGAWALLRFRTFKKIRPQAILLGPEPAAPGDLLTVGLKFHPTRDLSVERINFTLVGIETAVHGSGKQRRRHTQTVHQETVAPPIEPRIPAGQEVVIQDFLQIPVEAGPTFGGRHNQLTWTVKVHLAIPRAPDWNTSLTLRIR